MSRSIHETRASLARREAEDVSRADARDEAVERAKSALERKRAIKRSAASSPRPRERSHTPAELVPVEVMDTGAHVWYPASPDDVRAVLLRLPRGVTDGLRRIELRLGMGTQAELAAEDAGAEEPDPFTGRLSYPRYPGTWSGRIVGRYRPDAASIELYAYVVDPAHPLRFVWEPLLRLEALSVLAHEVAHHHDHTEQVARGRWIAEEEEAVERYAESMQHAWTHAVVLPHLRERYGDEVAAVERWVARHGGIALPFEEMADDPRGTLRGGFVHAERVAFPMSAALERLAEAVDRGDSLWETRLSFASELYCQSRFADALAIVGRVLRARPGETRALLLKANALRHLGHHARALAIARRVAAREPANERAWQTIADACEGLERWHDAEAAHSRCIELAEATGGPTGTVLIDRARVRIHTGDLAGARADLDRCEAGAPRHRRRQIARLRERIAAAEAENRAEPPTKHRRARPAPTG